jgi:hypothetical protein
VKQLIDRFGFGVMHIALSMDYPHSWRIAICELDSRIFQRAPDCFHVIDEQVGHAVFGFRATHGGDADVGGFGKVVGGPAQEGPRRPHLSPGDNFPI